MSLAPEGLEVCGEAGPRTAAGVRSVLFGFRLRETPCRCWSSQSYSGRFERILFR
jgi:hypothetical protein